jgi:peptidoglycan hydrolase CwlO-like protein
MEANTVVISLKRYEKFKLAENKLNKPRSKTIIIESGWGYNYTIETDDGCAEKMANDLKDAKEEISKLKEEISKLKEELETLKVEVTEITIDDVKKMNYWEFRKWKRS